MKRLYADDLVVLMAEMEELLVRRFRNGKSMEEKGLRVNLGETTDMKCEARF